MKLIPLSAQTIVPAEKKGLEQLVIELPKNWLGFPNIKTRARNPREIDLIIIADDKVVVLDLKNWSGRISCEDGYWFQNGKRRERDPLDKIDDNAKAIAGLLEHEHLPFDRRPYVDHYVVVSNSQADLSALSAHERERVLPINVFIKQMKEGHRQFNDQFRQARLRAPTPPICQDEDTWRRVFRRKGGMFEPQEAVFGGYVAAGKDPNWEHDDRLYAEYFAHKRNDDRSKGLLRYWDFHRLDGAPLAADIALYGDREDRAIGYLRDRRRGDAGDFWLTRFVHDDEYTARFWEVYDLRSSYERLDHYLSRRDASLGAEDRKALIRMLVVRVADLHRAEVAHRNLDEHTVWVEHPRGIVLSGFLTAHWPEMPAADGKLVDRLGGGLRLPEDVYDEPSTAAARDVFMLGALAWRIATFNPVPRDDGLPHLPADAASGLGAGFDAWCRKALNWTAAERYSDATVMAQAFPSELDQVEAAPIDPEEALKRFRLEGVIPYVSYPQNGKLLKTSPYQLYESTAGDLPVLVKLWPARLIGDLRAAWPRLEQLLVRAERLKALELDPVPLIACAGLPESENGLLVVQELVTGTRLDALDAVACGPERLLGLLSSFLQAVATLHEAEIAHGDLGLDNLLAEEDGDELEIVLLGLLDLKDGSAVGYGNTIYGPSPDLALDAFQADRYAVGRILADLIGRWCETIGRGRAEALLQAIAELEHTGIYPTLVRLQDCVDRMLVGIRRPPVPVFSVEVPGLPADGAFVSDGGRLHLRYDDRKAAVLVTGFDQQLVVKLSATTRGVESIRLVQLSPYQAGREAESRQCCTIEGEISLVASGRAALGQLADRIEKLLRASLPATPPLTSDAETPPVTAPSILSAHIEEIPPAEPEAAKPAAAATRPYFATAEIWAVALDAEDEAQLVIEAIDDQDADVMPGVVLVPFRSAQPLELARDEEIRVELLRADGTWRAIGWVEPSRTIGWRLAVRLREGRQEGRGIRRGDRLRLWQQRSHASFDRRRRAVERVRQRRAAIPNLIDLLERDASRSAERIHRAPRPEELAPYGLDASQSEAFVALWQVAPLAFLQGPPGTGKTKFIAALVHFALEHGGYRNVLVASQSHEAVNHAMRALSDVERRLGGDFSMLRVGWEDDVPPELRMFHGDTVRRRIGDEFHAARAERFVQAAIPLGIPEAFAVEAHETWVRIAPLARAIELMVRPSPAAEMSATEEDRPFERLKGMRASLAALLATCGLDDTVTPEGAAEAAIRSLARRHRLRDVAAVSAAVRLLRLCDDWEARLLGGAQGFEEFLVRSRNVVFGTCVGLGRTALGLERASFDLVVIDEATRCNGTELAVPMQVGRRVLLVGDHLQLPPMVDDEVREIVRRRYGEAMLEQLATSDFERAQASAYGRSASRRLTIQYRMAPAIGTLVSELFYGGGLENGPRGPALDCDTLGAPLDVELAWIDTSDRGEQGFDRRGERNPTSRANDAEADLILEVVRRLADDERLLASMRERGAEAGRAVGIISLYGEQKNLIEDRLEATPWFGRIREHVRIDTVDAYQGQENPIVILSLVRARRGQAGAFASSPKRLNVALSRAQERLIIVGSSALWGDNWPGNPLSQGYALIRDRGAAGNISAKIVSSRELLP